LCEDAEDERGRDRENNMVKTRIGIVRHARKSGGPDRNMDRNERKEKERSRVAPRHKFVKPTYFKHNILLWMVFNLNMPINMVVEVVLDDE
jgi:hypothetical protein